MGPSASPVALETRNIPYPCRESNHISSVAQPVAYSLHRQSSAGWHTTKLQARSVGTFHTREYYRVRKRVRRRSRMLSYEVSRFRPSTDNTPTFWCCSCHGRMWLPRTRHGRYNYELCRHHELSQRDHRTRLVGKGGGGGAVERWVVRPFRAAEPKERQNEYFNPYRSNVELTRQRCPLYQVQCRAQIDRLFYSVLCWFSLSCCYRVADFELQRLEIFWKINFDQTVGIHKNNLHCKGLNEKIRFSAHHKS